MLCTHAQQKQKERQEFRGYCIRTPTTDRSCIWFGYVILQVVRTKVQINQITFPRVQKDKTTEAAGVYSSAFPVWPLMLLRLINSDVKPGAGVLVILIAVRLPGVSWDVETGPAPISVLSLLAGRLRQGLLLFSPKCCQVCTATPSCLFQRLISLPWVWLFP